MTYGKHHEILYENLMRQTHRVSWSLKASLVPLIFLFLISLNLLLGYVDW